MSETLRMMCVLAHPDDESLGVGGTLAKYAAEGVETYLVTATRGERGRYGDGSFRPGIAELGRIREDELHAAAAVLGIREVSFLDYLDADLDRADPEEAIGKIVAHLRRVRPHVVVTFGPEGAYGHPDHIAISQFATAAVVAAADASYQPKGAEPHRVSKLYYLAWTHEAWAAYQDALKRLVVNVDGVERQAAPWPPWAITTEIDTSAFWQTAWRAISCHRSQVAIYEKLRDLPEAHHAALWGTQSFYRALSLVNGGRNTEDDLFEGIQ